MSITDPGQRVGVFRFVPSLTLTVISLCVLLASRMMPA